MIKMMTISMRMTLIINRLDLIESLTYCWLLSYWFFLSLLIVINLINIVTVLYSVEWYNVRNFTHLEFSSRRLFHSSLFNSSIAFSICMLYSLFGFSTSFSNSVAEGAGASSTEAVEEPSSARTELGVFSSLGPGLHLTTVFLFLFHGMFRGMLLFAANSTVWLTSLDTLLLYLAPFVVKNA